MSKKNFQTYIDFGASKIRIGIFNTDLPKNNYYKEENCLSNFDLNNINLEDSKKILKKLIIESEKELNSHIKNINLMIDVPDMQSIDFSIKKKLDVDNSIFDNIKFLLQEARQLAQKNNDNKKIIHTIVEKYILDERDYFEIPDEDIHYKTIAIEIKFICISNKFFEIITNHFKINHITIDNILCSSYVKSLDYNNFFKIYDKKAFLDIGYKKSCLTVFEKEKLILIKNIPLGGNHITKDISKVLEIDLKDSEKIKKSLNSKDVIFSNNSEEKFISNNNYKNIIQNNISLDLLKKVIYARIDEIFNFSLNNINMEKIIENKNKTILILTGEGSKILDKNSIYLENNYKFFDEMNFFEESVETICRSGFNFHRQSYNHEVKIVPKKIKKYGFFEKLFHKFG
tara:strand:- start:170 stop:1369 length:1200 start_codon:yes stop_codon:yes gene_type:complete